MTSDFVEDLIEACETEGIPFLIILGTDKNATAGFKTFRNLSAVDTTGYENVEDLMTDVIRSLKLSAS